MKARFAIAVVCAAVVAAGASVLAEDKPGVKADLEHYFAIRAALAGDKTEGVKEHADALAKSTQKPVAAAATKLSGAADIKAARGAFGDLSKVMIAIVETAAKGGQDVGTVHVFECPMAKPYGRWMQADEDMGNPYYGASMLKCGKAIAHHGHHGKKHHEGGDHH